MDARQLESKLNYFGMERCLRALAVKDKMDSLENIALKPCIEVCELILEHYEVIAIEDEIITLLPKEYVKEFNSKVAYLSR